MQRCDCYHPPCHVRYIWHAFAFNFMKKVLLILSFVFIESVANSQSDTISDNGFIIPKNLDECILGLDSIFTQNAKDKLKTLDIDTVKYISGIFIMNEWLGADSSRLKKYFKNLKLRYEYEMEYFIELSYYKYLTTGNYNISVQLNDYTIYQDSIDNLRHKQCESNELKDSLNDVYIPKDLTDSYVQLNRLLSDSLKSEIKNKTQNYHYSLGLWIRNNWGLWNCSRLYYFFKSNNINHPDDMSSLVLRGYKYFLNDTIYTIQELLKSTKQVDPIIECEESIIFRPPHCPYTRKFNKFIRRKKIDNFEVSNFTMIK
jgi:hypothetical protein